MKKLFLFLLITSTTLYSYGQRMQATLKPGITPKTIDVYLKSNASFSQRDEAMTLVIAIPATVLPKPAVNTQTGLGSAGVTANSLGPVAGITGLQPSFLVNNLGSTTREVYLSIQNITGVSYYVYTFIFANTALANHTWVADVEQLIFSIQFNGCTTNCNPSSQLLVNLPNGGFEGRDYFYFQPNSLGDITNVQAPFYQNAFSTVPVNGGNYSALSLVGLATPVSLPVKLTAFDVSRGNCNANLRWTASEDNSAAYYSVEASGDGVSFSEIKRVGASGQVGLKSYLYVDNAITTGKYFYRLKLVDRDEQFSYSIIKEMTLGCSDKEIKVFPTITNGSIRVMLPEGSENATVKIFNYTGQQILANNISSRNRLIDLSQYPAGTYLVHVITREKEVFNSKVVLNK